MKANSVKKEQAILDGKPVEGIAIQWLISKKDGTKELTMRCFTMNPDIITKIHKHPWEHILYILEGKGRIYTDKRWITAKPGDVFFIHENECHGYCSETRFVFLCVIPNIGDTR